MTSVRVHPIGHKGKVWSVTRRNAKCGHSDEGAEALGRAVLLDHAQFFNRSLDAAPAVELS
jgi:hypothetical protein